MNCDDGNPCTTDSCSLGACSNTALPVGTPCPVGFCNSSATCVAGVCAPGTTRSCYSGPAGTEGVGECQAGTETCDDTAQWGACVGEISPTPEVCGDGLDNDCSGTVDDGCEPTCEPNFVFDPDFGDCVRDQSTCPANLMPGGDLRGCALNGFNLSGINLSGADLTGADLRGTNFSGAILTNANLTGAFASANFTSANLIGANLSGAGLFQAALIGANLFGANLSGLIWYSPSDRRCQFERRQLNRKPI